MFGFWHRHDSAKYVYGWKRQLPDKRDFLFEPAPGVDVANLPVAVDLRQWCPPVMDQGQLGSCTAHGITGALRYDRIKAGGTDAALSRLQLYYDERYIEGTVKQDAGAEIRDGIKVAAKNGVGLETIWPYVISKFKSKPPKAVYTSALKDRALTYSAVKVDANSVKAALASGFPVIIGISVYESFESQAVANTGIVPMPGANEQLLGGHCIYIVGYGQKPGYFTVRNSWGTGWADKGDFYLPDAYVGDPNLGSDYWTISSVSK